METPPEVNESFRKYVMAGPTLEAQAWRVINEYAPRWANEYYRRYPNSKSDESTKAKHMAHYCVMAALTAACEEAVPCLEIEK